MNEGSWLDSMQTWPYKHPHEFREQQVQRQNAQPLTLFVFVFLFGGIVHITIRIRPNNLKPRFGTSLIIIIIIFFFFTLGSKDPEG